MLAGSCHRMRERPGSYLQQDKGVLAGILRRRVQQRCRYLRSPGLDGCRRVRMR